MAVRQGTCPEKTGFYHVGAEQEKPGSSDNRGIRGVVKLGFDIDAEVPVHRLEVWERIRAHGRRPWVVEKHKST